MSSVGSGGPTSWQIALFEAAGKGDESRVRELIREGDHFGEKGKDVLRIALQKVAGRGHVPLTRLLIEEGAEVNARSETDVSALFRASELGRDKVVRVLLEHKSSTEHRDKFKRTAIFPAAQRNHRSTLRLLLDAGADVNAKDEKNQTVLLALAAEKPDKNAKWGSEVIEILLDTKIDLEAKDAEERTALLWAAATGKETLARLLLTSKRHHANVHAVNNRGKSALHLAAENNRLALARLLVDHHADLHAQSDGGWGALHNAADKGHMDIAALLLERGANVNSATSSGMTALHWAARNGHTKVVKLLLQHGSRRNCKDSFESTPMLGAAQNGHIEVVQMLSPTNDFPNLSHSAREACKGFQATVVDFGMEKRPMNHHKHSVYDLLYGWDEKNEKVSVTTLTRNVPAKPIFRWIHLPTNNMAWVEALITKNFVENSARDVEGFKLLEKSLGQLHRGPTIHSHFMRPLCQRIDPTGRDTSKTDTDESTTETAYPPAMSAQDAKQIPGAPETATPTKSKAGKKNEKSERPARGAPGSNLSKKTRGTDAMKSKIMSGKLPRSRDRNGNIVLFMPYLHYETHEKRKQMSKAIKTVVEGEIDERPSLMRSRTCDEMLVEAYLKSTHNLHIRRTLDQFYYHAISTDDRDEDQVVWRYTRDKGKEKKLFMVDQLWLWVLGNDLIVTSFPQRWEQPKADPLNVLDGIIEDMSSKTRPPVRSAYDLAVLITGRCTGVFDRHRVGDGDYQFLDMFESSIGEVTNRETQLFRKFGNASEAAAKVLHDNRQLRQFQVDLPNFKANHDENASFVDTLLDIGQETSLLAETKDIRDELNMISMVLEHQLAILDDLANALYQELKGNHNQQKQAEIRRRFKEQHKVIQLHLNDVERMDRQAESIYTSLTHLLDLKQKHANALEARFARDQAAFTGRQGQTIMVFTIVTVVFLPLSFMAAMLTIPIRGLPKTEGELSLPLPYVSKFVFGVGLAISIPLIAVAFAVDSLKVAMRRIAKRWTPWRGDGGKNDGTRDQDAAKDIDHDPPTKSAEEKFLTRLSFGTESRSLPSTPPKPLVRHRTERSWRDNSRDLESGTK